MVSGVSRAVFAVFCCALLEVALHATPAACVSSTLTTYLNGGNPFSCTSGASVVTLNSTLLPSYAGLSLLPANNSAADPAAILVAPGGNGSFFNSSTFNEASSALSSQAEVVQFLVNNPVGWFTGTAFSLVNARAGTGAAQNGTALAIGQELVCLGGSFTSLPTALITSVANGVLGTGQFGCTGTVLVGTAAVSSGPLSAITATLALPNLTGVTDHAALSFGAANPSTVNVIKLQSLLTTAGGTAATDGFGDTFDAIATPEPATTPLIGVGLAVLALLRLLSGAAAA